MVGDRWKDIEAGRRAGCRTIFVDYGYSEVRAEFFDKRAESLTDAVNWILQNSPLLKGEQRNDSCS